MFVLDIFATQALAGSADVLTASKAAHTANLAYPDYSGGHPPLRGTAEYPYGHPGYFNGMNAGSCPGYTGGPTDTYGTYPGAGDSSMANETHTTSLQYPDYSGGHPPLRGGPDYPYGHPGYFNGMNIGSCPGYTGGPTDTYGTYPGAGDSSMANQTHTTSLQYPDYSSGHPPLRGGPDYPYGHPGYFNGMNIGSCPGYTGSPTDTYGTYPGAGDSSMANQTHTTALAWDKNDPDFVWQRGYSWCSPPPPQAEGGCAVYTTQQLAPVAWVAEDTQAEATAAESKTQTVAASPGHVLMLGHASLFGALDATWRMVCSGKADDWHRDFRNTSAEAAAAVSPVGGAIMRDHILRKDE